MKKVIINAAGGGDDLGLSGNGLVEKNITLDIAKKIRDKLVSKGVEVLMLRNDDSTIPYTERINEAINNYGTNKDVILLSNTLNIGESGIKIIYPLSKNNTLAKSLASSLEYFNDTDYYQQRYPLDTSKDYYLITRNTPNYETIIVKYANVDNINDTTILKNNIDDIANAVADTILNYIGISSSDYYKVLPGDTLYSISKKFNTTVDNIKQLNNLTSNTLSVNQLLKIPVTIESNTTTYKVASGDTLYSIANKFNISVNELKSLNNLTSNIIYLNQILKIPSENLKYKVVSGDTLYSIAKKYNTTVDNLKLLNNLKTNTLSIGQTLIIK